GSAEKAIVVELNKMKNQLVATTELEKVKNKTESLIAFEDISLMNRANSLATYELLGDADLMNKELKNYQAVTAEEILQECQNIFVENNCSTMYYRADKGLVENKE
ncbi:MAG: insulinase family protein, partial [Ginsengibacter sp.]